MARAKIFRTLFLGFQFIMVIFFTIVVIRKYLLEIKDFSKENRGAIYYLYLIFKILSLILDITSLLMFLYTMWFFLVKHSMFMRS
jgi:hypothetical protein